MTRAIRSECTVAACALIFGILVVIATGASAQVARQPQSITIPANSATLCALIGKMQVITFRYNYDPDAEDTRELEPYAVGYTRAGKPLLFGRQIKGYSKSAERGGGDLPGWRNFRVDKIKMGIVSASGSTFESVRPSPNEPRFISEFICKNELLQ